MKNGVNGSLYPRRITDVADIDKAINSIRQKNGIWHTNFYISREECHECVAEGAFSIFISTNSVLLFRRRTRFYILYFATSDLDDFRTSVNDVCVSAKENYIAYIIHKDNCKVEVIDILSELGFIRRSVLRRMVLKKQYSRTANSSHELVVANSDDVDEIYEIFYNNFDEFSDRLPSKQEIGKGIKSQRDDILVLRDDNGHIINIFWFVRQGKSILWKYWIIRPEYRDRGLGAQLAQCALSLYTDAMRIALWVRDNNPRAQALHRKLGFVPDNLNDNVMCLLNN